MLTPSQVPKNFKTRLNAAADAYLDKKVITDNPLPDLIWALLSDDELIKDEDLKRFKEITENFLKLSKDNRLAIEDEFWKITQFFLTKYHMNPKDPYLFEPLDDLEDLSKTLIQKNQKHKIFITNVLASTWRGLTFLFQEIKIHQALPPINAVVAGFAFLLEIGERQFISVTDKVRNVNSAISGLASLAAFVLAFTPVTAVIGSALIAGASFLGTISEAYLWREHQKKLSELLAHPLQDKKYFQDVRAAEKSRDESRNKCFQNALSTIGLTILVVGFFINPLVVGLGFCAVAIGYKLAEKYNNYKNRCQRNDYNQVLASPVKKQEKVEETPENQYEVKRDHTLSSSAKILQESYYPTYQDKEYNKTLEYKLAQIELIISKLDLGGNHKMVINDETLLTINNISIQMLELFKMSKSVLQKHQIYTTLKNFTEASKNVIAECFSSPNVKVKTRDEYRDIANKTREFFDKANFDIRENIQAEIVNKPAPPMNIGRPHP